VKYYTNASGGLTSVDANVVASRYTVRGWMIADDLTAQPPTRPKSEAVPLHRDRLNVPAPR
jgi:hypothetical protein